MNHDELVPNKVSVFIDWLFASAYFVVIIAFACMEGIATEVFFRFGHNQPKDFFFLTVVTVLTLWVSLVFARSIAKLLPTTAGLLLFQHKATKCGHMTYRKGKVSAFGQSATIKMPKNGPTEYCLDCIGRMTIQCAWCGQPIFIGSPITLYSPVGNFQAPAHAVVHRESPLQIVGCLGWECAEAGGDRAGFWVPGENGKGRVKRVSTAYELIMGLNNAT